jgi:hypothetical protein
MISVSNTSAAPAIRDPDMEWCERRAMPIVEDFGLDIRKVSVAPWAHDGMHGAFCRSKGRNNFLPGLGARSGDFCVTSLQA